jgi:hypothetical protein
MSSTPQTHVSLAAALARGFRFDPDAPLEAPAEQTPMEALGGPQFPHAEVTPELMEAMFSEPEEAAAEPATDEAAATADTVDEDAPAAEATTDDSASGEADGEGQADDADAETPAPAADKAAPAEPKAPAKQTVQAPAADPEAERLEADYKAVQTERRALLAKIAGDEGHDPLGEDATRLNRLTAKFELLKEQRDDRKESATQAQLQSANDERQFVSWSEDEAKKNPGRDAAGWREEWGNCVKEIMDKYQGVPPEKLEFAIKERFAYQQKLLNGRAASEKLKAQQKVKTAAAAPKKPTPPVTPNGARTTPRASTAPSNPAPAAGTTKERLYRGDYDAMIARDMESLGL